MVANIHNIVVVVVFVGEWSWGLCEDDPFNYTNWIQGQPDSMKGKKIWFLLLPPYANPHI